MKKGSLNLSINAIVVLIMAVALLGLGLGFLRNMFSNLEGQIGDISKDTEQRMVQGLEDSNERLALDKTKFEIKQGKTGETYLGLRNELSGKFTYVVDGSGTIDANTNPGDWKEDDSVITCYSAFDPEADLTGKNEEGSPIYFTAIAKRSLKEGDSYVGKMLIKVNGKAPEGTYDCAIVLEDPSDPGEEYDRIDFEVTITEG
ncbi:hypothetical protein HN789_00580 [archaeon]|jgi:hypothetical protein|nr:hypothetical protein [archaeon]MBT4022024.1 hypothetical protein [archaeon]MBT4272637.1 hypothetical protein [archaeon]MBT4461435.1 hypothetical protein [archaeon]MBT4857795.1 hypothetical protein [archaeon]